MRHAWWTKSLGAVSSAVAATCCVVPVSTVSAQTGISTNRAPMEPKEYLGVLQEISRYELDTGRLALARSRQKATRSFAQMMIRDHTRMMAKRRPMLSPSEPANALAEPLSQMLDTLKETPLPGFDAAYKRGQIAAHEDALKIHRAYAARGSDPALRAMAQRAMPAIQKHLDTARKLLGHKVF